MSYLNQAQDPRRRATAIVTVGAVHALLAIGLVSGLAVEFTNIIGTRVKATNIPLDPPKPEPDPVPTAKPVETTYTPTDPPTVIQLPTDSTVVRDPVESDQTEITYFPTGSVDPPVRPVLPPPPPRFTVEPARPSNSSANWITTDDYPRRELVDGREGSVGYRLVISTKGEVSSCEITRPSGVLGLDTATCRLITRRAKFKPATDEAGIKVLGTYSGSVTWQIPG